MAAKIAGMAHPTGSSALALDASRDEALAHAARLIGEAWRSFDRFRPGQPEPDPVVRALTALPLPAGPTGVHAALEEAARVLDASISQPRPRYFAFVGSSGLPVGVLADALASCHDVNLAVSALAADLVEEQALRWTGELVGFPVGGGTITSGGMLSNLTALAVARERALPGARRTGLAGRPCAVYCSVEAHQSIERAAEVLGIGADLVRGVPIDADRRLVPGALRTLIEADCAAGIAPVAVVATAGTTLTGAVDPIDAIADVCAERSVWLHVDGAYGLPGAAAPSSRARFAGLERADSASVDAHKWLYLPKACSVLMLRDPHGLESTFRHDSAYMLHDEESPVHAVDRTLEYSRPFRALKLWLALRVHGADQFRAALEGNLALARHLADRVRAADDLELLVEPQLTVVPFRHAPAGVADLDAHNERLAVALQEDGHVFVSSAVIDGRVCLRPCVVNFRTTVADVDALVDLAREVGGRLARG